MTKYNKELLFERMNKVGGMPINESIVSNTLADGIDNLIDNLDSSMSTEDFALAVGKILKEQYGQHNYDLFMKTLHNYIGMPLNEEVFRSKYGHITIDKPLIDEAEFLLSGNPNVIEVNSKEEYDKLINQQQYFSASHSRAFDNEEAYNKNIENIESDILFETGHVLVGLWNANTNKGWVLPKENIK